MTKEQLRHNLYFPIETENIKVRVLLTKRCWNCGDNDGKREMCEFCDGKGYNLTDAGRVLKTFVEGCCND